MKFEKFFYCPSQTFLDTQSTKIVRNLKSSIIEKWINKNFIVVSQLLYNFYSNSKVVERVQIMFTLESPQLQAEIIVLKIPTILYYLKQLSMTKVDVYQF
jgi:hypothetical protein